MRPSTIGFACALAIGLALASPARAFDVALNVGAVEVIGEPGGAHLGTYPYLGVSLVKAWKRAALIPGLAVEVAPESGRWGLVATVGVDVPVGEKLGVDVTAVLLHDQPGFDFAKAELLVGGGVGCSVFLERWTFSPYVNVLYDLMVAGWVVVPGINLAVTL